MDGQPDYPFPGGYDDFDDGCEPCPDCGGHIPVMDDEDNDGDEGFGGGHPGMGGYDGGFDPYGGGGYGGGYPGMGGMGGWFL